METRQYILPHADKVPVCECGEPCYKVFVIEDIEKEPLHVGWRCPVCGDRQHDDMVWVAFDRAPRGSTW